MNDNTTSPHHHLIDRGTADLLVIFSGASRKPGQFDFRGYAERTAHSVLLINNGQNQWYQQGVPSLGASIDALIAEIRSIARRIGSTRLHFTGASMGGYAAMLFGSLFRAPALAFAADTRLRLPHTHSMRLMVGDAVFPDLRPLLAASSELSHSHMIVGGMDVMDMVGADHVRKFCNVICEPQAGHGITGFLRERNQLDTYIETFLAGRINPAEKTIPSAEAIQLLYQIRFSPREKDCKDMLLMAERARKIETESLLVKYYLGYAKIKTKQYGDAVEIFRFLASEAPANEDIHFYYGFSLRLAGEKSSAESILLEHLARWPSSARVKTQLQALT